MEASSRARADHDDSTVQLFSPRKEWFARVFRRRPGPTHEASPLDTNPLLAFASEIDPPAPVTTRPAVPARTTAKSTWLIVAAGAAVATVGFGAFVMARGLPGRAPVDVRPAQLTIHTRPSGAEVIIDGQRLGVTPFAQAVKPGAHSVTVRIDGRERVLPLELSAGAQVSQYLEMPVPQTPASAVGRISVVTDPPGARVSIDGQALGVSPLTVSVLTADEHRVSVRSDAGSAERVVAVERGATASVVFSLPKTSAPVGGWLAVNAPFEVQVLERDEVVGASGTTKIMLAAGKHDVLLVNRALGYQETRKFEVTGGKVTTVRVDPPKATLSVNARPWAEVTIDANSVGQTPIANLAVTIGTHQVTFRHPQFGERRQTVLVTTKGPNRIAIDMTR